jgi:hypothetical protein
MFLVLEHKEEPARTIENSIFLFNLYKGLKTKIALFIVRDTRSSDAWWLHWATLYTYFDRPNFD